MAIGDHLSDVKVLWGVAGCVNTSKILLTAAEKGVDLDGRSVDVNSEAEMKEIKKHSPFGSIPVLKDVDFVIYGTEAIMSYLDDKGFGNSLVPRNGVARAINYQWAHIANDAFGPAVAKLTGGDDSAMETVRDCISALEAQLNARTKRGDYIVGEFSLADIHWAPSIHALCLHGQESLIDTMPGVKAWWGTMKVRKSMSKENYVAYTTLPSLDEIRSNKLRSVSINVQQELLLTSKKYNMFGFFKNKKQDNAAKINGSQTLKVKVGENLLKAALEADIAWPHDCRVGSCGTCKCRLVEGKIKPLADFAYVLEMEELQDNYILACQTALKTDIEVEVELLANGEQQHHWESDAVIKEVRDLTYDIKELVIEIIDPENVSASELLYKAGQYADLKLPHLTEGRSYSFATAPTVGQKEFLFYIRKVPGGEFTDWLFEENRTGQTLTMSGPYGKFGLAEEPATMNCVAGGSGMSAVVGVLQAALESGVKRDVRFIFGARSQKDLYCDELIADMAAQWQSNGLGSFEYIPCLSEEPEDSSWQGRRGRCTEFIVDSESNSVSGQAYLCGPPGMIDAAIGVFKENGIAKDAIFFDKFLDKSSKPQRQKNMSRLIYSTLLIN